MSREFLPVNTATKFYGYLLCYPETQESGFQRLGRKQIDKSAKLVFTNPKYMDCKKGVCAILCMHGLLL